MRFLTASWLQGKITAAKVKEKYDIGIVFMFFFLFTCLAIPFRHSWNKIIYETARPIILITDCSTYP